MSVAMRECGTVNGHELIEFTIDNGKGLAVRVLNYGAIVSSIRTPDRDGRVDEVTLGFDQPADYVRSNPPYFGAVCGRYANRIAHGRFALDGVEYSLAANCPPNHLHGGARGFDKRFWSVAGTPESGGNRVKLCIESPDGEEGYPGNVKAAVTYSVTPDNALRLDYEAVADRATPVNLTNHTYFNLGGPGVKDALGHAMETRAARYLPTDETLIPTGEIKDVRGSPLDFLQPSAIGSRFSALPAGYDHNLILDGASGADWCIRVRSPESGRTVEMTTTEPGVQFYTGHYLDGIEGRGGMIYRSYAGFCMEAQHYPDSPNRPEFPSTILRPGETYRQTTAYRFLA